MPPVNAPLDAETILALYTIITPIIPSMIKQRIILKSKPSKRLRAIVKNRFMTSPHYD